MQDSQNIVNIPGDWLVLDASCLTTRVALFHDGKLLKQLESETHAMESLLTSVQQLVRQQNIAIKTIRGFIYCMGPGSILGIRLSIMAIKTWCAIHQCSKSRVLSFNSLAMAALATSEKLASDESEFAVISEWKKDHWNGVESNNLKHISQIEVWDRKKTESYQKPLFLLPQRKQWTQNLENIPPVSYDLSLLNCLNVRMKVLQPMNDWEIYTPEVKDYVKWSKNRHR